MKKKKLFIVLLILGILLLIPVSFTIIDKIRYDNGKSAIFVKESDNGCEQIVYAGIFYSINYSVPQIGPEDDSGGDNSSWVWFWEH